MAQAIRAQQPEGPYFLGGFCENGTMAYEVARSLAITPAYAAAFAGEGSEWRLRFSEWRMPATGTS